MYRHIWTILLLFEENYGIVNLQKYYERLVIFGITFIISHWGMVGI